MPDLLILSEDQALTERLSTLAAEYNFRIKHSAHVEVAREWLSNKPFEALLLSPGISRSALESLAAKLWELNSLAPIIVVAPDSQGDEKLAKERLDWSLAGASFLEGQQAFAELRAILVKLAAKKLKPGLQFRVLVVEDLDSPRDIICSFVEHIGYPAVQGVGSAKEALEMLDKTPGKFSCVITDINMPSMNGRELIQSIRRNRKLKHLPVIVLTAYGTVENLVECLKVGASGFLVKPPTKAELNRELGRAFRIIEEQEDPSLTSESEIAHLKSLLTDRGFF